jgi:DNA-binding GntR family transcriptional regulator
MANVKLKSNQGIKKVEKTKPALGLVASGKRSLDIQNILRDRIAKQEIPPGAKLGESELANEFAVPRNIIREALSGLEQRELIKRIPNRGAVVIRLDLSQVFEIYDTREVLEGLCARLATQNVSPDSWQDLVDLFNGRMKQYIETHDYESFLAGYGLFRRRMLLAANNPVLTNMLDMVYEKTQAIIRRILILPGRAAIGLKEHQAVLDAMRSGNADLAEQLRRENIRSAKDALRRYESFVL